MSTTTEEGVTPVATSAKSLPETMTAVLLTGHGGLEKLEYRTDVAVPAPAEGEVLIEVAAAGINNTDINTSIGWYSKTVSSGTSDGGAAGFTDITDSDAAWSGEALTFPRIQGADVADALLRSAREFLQSGLENGFWYATCCGLTSATGPTNAGRSAANATADSPSSPWPLPAKPTR